MFCVCVQLVVAKPAWTIWVLSALALQLGGNGALPALGGRWEVGKCVLGWRQEPREVPVLAGLGKREGDVTSDAECNVEHDDDGPQDNGDDAEQPGHAAESPGSVHVPLLPTVPRLGGNRKRLLRMVPGDSLAVVPKRRAAVSAGSWVCYPGLSQGATRVPISTWDTVLLALGGSWTGSSLSFVGVTEKHPSRGQEAQPRQQQPLPASFMENPEILDFILQTSSLPRGCAGVCIPQSYHCTCAAHVQDKHPASIFCKCMY